MNGAPVDYTPKYSEATVGYTYAFNPATRTATTAGRWVRTTADGLGRPVKVESGDGSGTKSIVETEYDRCPCSPLGKVKSVSQPYPGGQSASAWTTYTYDALGNRLARNDGGQVTNLTGVANDAWRMDRVRMGAVSALDTGTRGTYYFDAFESRRQTYIGP